VWTGMKFNLVEFKDWRMTRGIHGSLQSTIEGSMYTGDYLHILSPTSEI
jgi:hypothetical protein